MPKLSLLDMSLKWVVNLLQFNWMGSVAADTLSVRVV